jgi:hypothetical protein
VSILQFRLEDGTLIGLDTGQLEGRTIEGSNSVAAAAIAIDTGFSPAPGQAAMVALTLVAFDAVTPAAAGGAWDVVLRNAAGTLTIAGSGASRAIIGDAGLTADLGVTFSVSAGNTLVVNVTSVGYGEPLSVVGVLATGVTT